MLTILRTLAAAAACMAAAFAAAAQDVVVFGDQAPSEAELADVLLGTGEAAPALKMRGIVRKEAEGPFAGGRPPAPAPEAPAAAGAAPQRTVAMNIEFAFNSAEVPDRFRPHLDALAGVLKRPEAAEKRLIVVGHTDSAGRDDYNEDLSFARARAVRTYLISRHGVAPSRILASGLGETQPLPGRAADAGENRRVEFNLN